MANRIYSDLLQPFVLLFQRLVPFSAYLKLKIKKKHIWQLLSDKYLYLDLYIYH